MYMDLTRWNNEKIRFFYLLCDVLNTLAEFQSGESLEDVINTIGDANDCGCVATWDDLIDRLIELFNNGERIPL